MVDTKLCKICEQHKPLIGFIVDKRNTDGRGAWCYPCKNKYNRTYVNKYPHKRKESQSKYDRKRRYQKYGLTEEEFTTLIEITKKSCEICGYTSNKSKLDDICIDHNHLTGEVRGILCNPCNQALGLFRDSPNLLLRAIEYIRKSDKALIGGV